jgi:hypothetical protein
MIRSVKIHIHNTDYILGFSFFDKDRKLIWKIGNTDLYLNVKTVMLGENEVIDRIVAKLYSGFKSAFTDFQLQMSTRLDCAQRLHHILLPSIISL